MGGVGWGRGSRASDEVGHSVDARALQDIRVTLGSKPSHRGGSQKGPLAGTPRKVLWRRTGIWSGANDAEDAKGQMTRNMRRDK